LLKVCAGTALWACLFFSENLFAKSPKSAEGFKRSWRMWSTQLPEANLDATILYFFPEDGTDRKDSSR
jgi:hypothetical protein